MNELKQYAQQRMQEFSFRKPASYDESTYRKIKSLDDIAYHFRCAENFVSSCENEGNAGRLPDYDEQDVAVYNAYVALEAEGAVTLLADDGATLTFPPQEVAKVNLQFIF